MAGDPSLMWFWSSLFPAPQTGYRNAIPQSQTDGLGQDLSWEHPNYTGVRSPFVTATTTLTTEDCGKIVVCNPSVDIIVYLPPTIPFFSTTTGNWWVRILNIGSAQVFINPNGRKINNVTETSPATTPVLAAASGDKCWSCIIDTDNTDWFLMLISPTSGGGGGGGGLNGVKLKTADYTTGSGDSGYLLSFSSASPPTSLTLTLPSSPPSSSWFIFVENTGPDNLTINRNGLLIDGVAGNFTVRQNQGLLIATDGTNYYTSRGMGGSRLDIPYLVTGFFPGQYQAAQILARVEFNLSVTFGVNWVSNFAGLVCNPQGHVTGLPASGATVLINKNSSTNVGTISITTGGVVSFVTAGGVPITLVAGDYIDFIGQNPADASLAGLSVVMAAQRN